MPLSPGTTLGHFEIEALLGAGGMGEVYKANDTRLHRTVAIKVLPEGVASDPGLKQRFEREARTVAQLNHPHICTLHDIGSEEGTDFLVMEHLEGETLADRLAKGALPLDEALKIAIEIGDAMDKAHRQGIVHRDLKPGNIMLTSTGAKLLDFGLAKLKAAEMEAGLTAMATGAAPLTGEGTILGTFQYMAPEQLEGKEADSRTNIFAFGAVVYEMINGNRAFEGLSQASLISSIMSGDPPSLGSLQPLSPAALEHVVGVCLEKVPDQRWQSASDLGKNLRWIAEGGADVGTASALVASRKSGRWIRAGIAGVVIGLFIGGLAVWALLAGRTTVPSGTTTRFAVTLPDSFRLPNEGGTTVALSPDGQTIVYRATRERVTQLFRRPIDQFSAVPMMDTKGGRDPFFSHDGQWLGFFADGALRKVALSGGPAQALTRLSDPDGNRGASWDSDDMIVFGRAPGLEQVPAAGGEPIVLAEPEGAETGLWYPQVLPGTGAILLTVAGPTSSLREVQILLPETGERRSVLPNASAGRVLATGHLIFVRNGALWAVPFDQDRLDIAGRPAPVVEGVRVFAVDAIRGGAVQYSVADNGTLVYLPVTDALAIESTLVLVDRQGTVHDVPLPSNDYVYPRFSPDGTRIAVQINAGNDSNIFIYELPAIDWASSRLVGGSFRFGRLMGHRSPSLQMRHSGISRLTSVKRLNS